MKVVITEGDWIDDYANFQYEDLKDKKIHLWLACLEREELLVHINASSRIDEVLHMIPHFRKTILQVEEECADLDKLLIAMYPSKKSAIRRQKMRGKPLMEIIQEGDVS